MQLATLLFAFSAPLCPCLAKHCVEIIFEYKKDVHFPFINMYNTVTKRIENLVNFDAIDQKSNDIHQKLTFF